MDATNKKILYLTLEKETLDQIKNNLKKSELKIYNKHWINEFMYPCGTIKNFELISLQTEDHAESENLVVEFKGIKIIKEKKSWLRSEKKFEIEFGNLVDSKNADKSSIE